MLKLISFSILIFFIIYRIYGLYSSRNIRNKLEELYKKRKLKKLILKRNEIVSSLKNNDFDIAIIGGGCVGAGCLLDAASRGLKVCLIEESDFGSETSSKNTKLLHGGIRYLQKAFMKFNLSQLKLVLYALNERNTVMEIAPYLTKTIRIMVPIYNIFLVPLYFILTKLYDWLSYKKSLGRSYLLSTKNTSLYFSNFKSENLQNAMVYHDGMMLDFRINVMLVKTAVFYGATAANHVKFLDFIKNESNQIIGMKVLDQISKEEFDIKSKVVISSAGPFTDDVRKYNTGESNIITPSMGTHIVISPGFGTDNMGILDTRASDNRIVFILPWCNHTIIGSTEVGDQKERTYKPPEDQVFNLLNEINKYTEDKIKISELKSAWSAYRPLVKLDNCNNVDDMVRDYKVIDEKNGLITSVGGKWTTFRLMAEHSINLAVEKYKLNAINSCLTSEITILGSRKYSRDLYFVISRVLKVDIEYAKHLLDLYGSSAFRIENYIKKYPKLLSEKYLFKEGEAIYVLENELAMNSSDIVNNRFGVGYYDVEEAYNMVKRVDKLLIEYYKEQDIEYQPDNEYNNKILDSLGYELVTKFKNSEEVKVINIE